jgi:carbonic anhydrase
MKLTASVKLLLVPVLLILAFGFAEVEGRRGKKGAPRKGSSKSSDSAVFEGGECLPEQGPAGSECDSDNDCCASPGDAPFRYKLVCYRDSQSTSKGSGISKSKGKGNGKNKSKGNGRGRHQSRSQETGKIGSGTCYPDWGYGNGFLEPDEWEEVYPICAGGERQGPTDIPFCDDLNDLSALTPMFTIEEGCNSFNLGYEPFNQDLSWGRGNFEQTCNVTSGIDLPGEQYSFFEFHLHMPAESLVCGHRNDGELHFIHFNGENIVLLVVFLEASDSAGENLFIQELLDSIDGSFGTIPITTTQTYAEFIGIEDKKWFNFESGSTSPPCQETVEMWLAPEPVPITMTQLESLMTAALIFDRAGVNGNARPAQPFNDRVIFPTL